MQIIPRLALTGINTDIGKTTCAAIWTQATGCGYWKPIQAGCLEYTDTDCVCHLLSRTDVILHPEAYLLQQSASPHVSAQAQKIIIDLAKLIPPEMPKEQRNTLLIETAGGVCSPISAQHIVADYLSEYQIPTVLVVRHYLGSISHTLSAIDALHSRNVSVLGIIVNGSANMESEQFITDYSQVPVIAHIAELGLVNAAQIAVQAQRLTLQLLAHPILSHWITSQI